LINEALVELDITSELGITAEVIHAIIDAMATPDVNGELSVEGEVLHAILYGETSISLASQMLVIAQYGAIWEGEVSIEVIAESIVKAVIIRLTREQVYLVEPDNRIYKIKPENRVYRLEVEDKVYEVRWK
jgi:hypothetical protein